MKRFFLIFLIFCGFLFLNGCSTVYNPVTGRQELTLISIESEKLLGADIAGKFTQENKIYEDEKINKRVAKIGNSIAAYRGRKDIQYKFHVIDTDKINAVAIPGGYIFIFKELIEKTTDDELANVIAHEIAHIEARHSVKKLQAVLGYSLLVNIAFRGENYAEIVRYSNLIFDLVLKGYSRRDEFEADSTGVVLAYRAGYKPEAMISFLNKLKKLNENSGLEIEFLSTHPSYDNRMESIQKTISILKGGLTNGYYR